MFSRRRLLSFASFIAMAATLPMAMFGKRRSLFGSPITLDLYSRDVITALLPPHALKEFTQEVYDRTSGRVKIRFRAETLSYARENFEKIVYSSPYKIILFSTQLRKDYLLLPKGPWNQSGEDPLLREQSLLSEEVHRAWVQAYLPLQSYPLYFGILDETTVLELGLHPRFVQELPSQDLLALKLAAENVGKRITSTYIRRISKTLEPKSQDQEA